MRKVNLNMKELEKYQIIKKLVDENGNKNRAAVTLGCTRRTINRLIIVYKEKGKAGFIHGNRDREPSIKIDDSIKQEVILLYQNKYYNANFKHFSELLKKHEGISVSDTTIRDWFFEEEILSPKARKKTKQKLKDKLKKKSSAASTISEKRKLEDKIESLSRNEAHPHRPRCAYFGEMIQMDASPHLWFGDIITHLHLAIDDSTGMIVGAYFDTQETLNAYYHVFSQILTNYGIPAKFLTDRRTVFEYKRKNASSDEEDTFTQFSYACKQLGVVLECSSIPQAKGRVERLNQTLQSRLVVELRLANVSTIEEANEFLKSFLKEFNAKFSLPINNTKTVFEKQPGIDKINQILAVISNRKLDAGHCIRYKKKTYIPVTASGAHTYFHKGMHALVIESFDHKLYVNILDHLYALEEIPERLQNSPLFDEPAVEPKKHKIYIPPLSHPWKQASFNAYLARMKHRDPSINL